MGLAKAWLPLGPRWPQSSFLRRILEVCRDTGCGPRLVVHAPTMPFVERIAALGGWPVLHPTAERGRTGSVQAGLQSLPRGAAAVLLWPIDMPLVRAATVARLLHCAGSTPQAIVQPGYAGRLGHPLILPRACWPAILAAEPDAPLRTLIADVPRRVCKLNDPGVRVNLNTMADYRAARAELAGS